jgi:hypothetical protein
MSDPSWGVPYEDGPNFTFSSPQTCVHAGGNPAMVFCSAEFTPSTAGVFFTLT